MNLEEMSVQDLIKLQTETRRVLKSKHLWYETERPSWDVYFSRIAQVVSERGSCVRRKVGAVLTDKNNNILSTGYNGKASRLVNCSVCPCAGASKGSGSCLTECEAIHAEVNAIIRCKDMINAYTVYVTCSPCVSCIDVLLATGCQRVVFTELYAVHEESKRRWEAAGREWVHLIYKTTNE